MINIKKQAGFTIVETMIVLGVTGVLFVSVSLLISGQTERYRYRDSMYRLQQQVQAQINDVQSGQFYNTIAGSEGKTSEVLVGKNILFKIDSNGSMTNSIIKKAGVSYENINEQTTQLPGGINYTGYAQIGSSISASNFSFDVKFANEGGGATSSSSLQFDLFSVGPDPNVLSSTNDGKGYLLCFEGYKKGSLELGSKELGNTVKLNLVDSRCD